MHATSADTGTPSPGTRFPWYGWLLLLVGLLGHVYAAHAMGGSRIAYTHHVFGFFLILVVTGVVIAGLGYWFWRARPALSFLIIGIVQAALGLWIAVTPFRGSTGH